MADTQEADAPAQAAAGNMSGAAEALGDTSGDVAGDTAASGVRAKPGSRGESRTISDEEVSALLEKGASDSVRAYDLTAQRINQTQLPMLEMASKTFADRIGASLSTLLNRETHVHFTGLDTAKAADVQAALPIPATLALVRLKPLSGNAFLCVEPTLLLALLDGFFGGSGRATSDAQAAIAPAAQRFLALMLRTFAPDWQIAWQPVTPLELELVKQETNPRLMQLGAPQDSLLVLKFSVEFGARSGRIDLMVPEAMLAPIRESLVSPGGAPAPRRAESWAPVLGVTLQEANLETRAILAQAEISLRELVRLTPGDIIPIDAPQHVTLLAGEVPLYRGRFGVSQGRNALKIIPGGSV